MPGGGSGMAIVMAGACLSEGETVGGLTTPTELADAG